MIVISAGTQHFLQDCMCAQQDSDQSMHWCSLISLRCLLWSLGYTQSALWTDQGGQIRRLIWVFTGHICIHAGNAVLPSKIILQYIAIQQIYIVIRTLYWIVIGDPKWDFAIGVFCKCKLIAVIHHVENGTCIMWTGNSVIIIQLNSGTCAVCWGLIMENYYASAQSFWIHSFTAFQPNVWRKYKTPNLATIYRHPEYSAQVYRTATSTLQ